MQASSPQANTACRQLLTDEIERDVYEGVRGQWYCFGPARPAQPACSWP